MAFTPSRAEAPGNMIVMGEYAVLHGARAVLVTTRHRLSVQVRPSGRGLRILSDKFGAWETGQEKPPHVVLCENVLWSFFGDEPASVEIEISSDIPPTYGFGSSAALVAALVKALHGYIGQEAVFKTMFRIGHQAIMKTFGRGSGADLAAALADMPCVVFDPVLRTVEPFTLPFVMQAIYTGYKTPTPEVLRQVAAEVPDEKMREIVKCMRGCIDAFIEDPQQEHITYYQNCMDELGVTCGKCREALDIFTNAGGAAKISGSGRGDCVIALSPAPVNVAVAAPLEYLPSQELFAG